MFHLVQPWGDDKYSQATIVSTHATVAEAYAALDRIGETLCQDEAPDEILVTPSTDPGWTPLFLRAGGLVMETGGYLSHGAIVAREFGIPAVVNIPGVLDRVHDGDKLLVDGNRGIVAVSWSPLKRTSDTPAIALK